MMKWLTGSYGRGLVTGMVLAAAFWLGSSFREPAAIGADSHKNPSPPMFLAGSERTIPILQDIAATLKRIDTRLDRLEKWVQAQPKR
ncbi:MAG: hypothetical protein H8E44_44500 [Planctomycetes bacterium]|nr:hypothetical protein [Planctomycetota bacterium]